MASDGGRPASTMPLTLERERASRDCRAFRTEERRRGIPNREGRASPAMRDFRDARFTWSAEWSRNAWFRSLVPIHYGQSARSITLSTTHPNGACVARVRARITKHAASVVRFCCVRRISSRRHSRRAAWPETLGAPADADAGAERPPWMPLPRLGQPDRWLTPPSVVIAGDNDDWLGSQVRSTTDLRGVLHALCGTRSAVPSARLISLEQPIFQLN